jgi:hypothetical protein
MVALPRWWVVFGDRNIVAGSGAADAYAVPGRDVQAVISPCPDHGWELWSRGEFYVFLPSADAWRPVDQWGLFDYLLEPGPRKVLFGRTMFDPEFYALLAWLNEHPDLPMKTGFRPGEQR